MYSISLPTTALSPRVVKTAAVEGTLAPTAGEAVEIRIDDTVFTSKAQFHDALTQLLQTIRERSQPRFPS